MIMHNKILKTLPSFFKSENATGKEATFSYFFKGKKICDKQHIKLKVIKVIN